MTPIIKLKNLPKNASREEVRAVLATFGNVSEAKIEVNAVTDASLGVATARFETQDAANRALASGNILMHNQEVLLEAAV